MAAYTIIADVSETILELLQEKLVPEVLQNKGDIGICRPNEKGDATLGILLYHIEENLEIKNQNRVFLDDEHFLNPPSSLNLYYMIFARSDASVATKSVDEQRVLGKAIQVLDDNSRIPPKYFKGSLTTTENKLDMQNLVLTFSEASAIHTLFDRSFVLSVFYKVGPVFMDMSDVKKVSRVKTADISVEVKNRSKI